MYFPDQDVTHKPISSSYQNILRRYGNRVVDSLGNGILEITSSGYSFKVVESLSSSYSIDSDYSFASFYATNSGTSSYCSLYFHGSVDGNAFEGNPKTYTVFLNNPLPDDTYIITAAGEDVRIWSVGMKTTGSFLISSNSNRPLSGMVYWHVSKS